MAPANGQLQVGKGKTHIPSRPCPVAALCHVQTTLQNHLRLLST
jgi:hypothetical protein